MEFERVNKVDTKVAFEKLFDKLDYRNYDVAGYALKELGISKIRILTNNPLKINSVEKQGIEVIESVKLKYEITPKIKKYLDVKKEKFNHRG
ncbi:MAG: bifunctional 3,4-dihydroxy-2-butanone-4-phosphate synthase/GTP cyclohydrolase II, partial [Candidatus Woesearchaeota archaeon]